MKCSTHTWVCVSGCPVWLGWLCACCEGFRTDSLSTSTLRESISDCFDWFVSMSVWMCVSNCWSISTRLVNGWGSVDKMALTCSKRAGASGLWVGMLPRHWRISPIRRWSSPISWRYSTLRSTSETGMIAPGFCGSGQNASPGNGHLPQRVWMIKTP